MFIAFQIIHYVIVKSMFPPYRPYTMIWNAISTSILKNFRKTKLLKTYVSGCIDDDDDDEVDPQPPTYRESIDRDIEMEREYASMEPRIYKRGKLDPFHFMNSLPISLSHSLVKDFFQSFRNVLFVYNTEDREEVTKVFRKKQKNLGQRSRVQFRIKLPGACAVIYHRPIF
jgi:hypothetical protein